MLNMKKCVVISQPECRRYCSMTIDLIGSIFVSFQRVRVFKGSIDKGFP
jgi:hypothetical protein